MSGQWQQYAPNPGVHPTQAGHGYQQGFSQSGGYVQQRGFNPHTQQHQAPSQFQYPSPSPYQPPNGYTATQQGEPYMQGYYAQQPHQAMYQPQPGGHHQQHFPGGFQTGYQPNNYVDYDHYHQAGHDYLQDPYGNANMFHQQQAQRAAYPHAVNQFNNQSVASSLTHPSQPSPYPSSQFSPPQKSPANENNCFNCGSPDHWAQDCPEPRRAVPYGQMMQTTRTQKRFRPGFKPPVVTRYAVPPHIVGAQIPTPHTTPPLWNQQTPPFPTPAPTVPSPSHYAWPEKSPKQFELPRPPQGAPLESQHQREEQRRPSHGHLTPASVPEQHGGHARGSVSDAQVEAEPAPQPETMSRQPSRASNATDQSVSMASESDDEEDEEYLRLDIPDLPNLHCYGGAKPPQLVAVPLPALATLDEMGALAQPNEEIIHSKYCNASWLDLLEANVRYLSEFENMEDDPIFLAIPEDTAPIEKTPSPKSPLRVPIDAEQQVQRSETPQSERSYIQTFEGQAWSDQRKPDRLCSNVAKGSRAFRNVAPLDRRDSGEQARSHEGNASTTGDGSLDQLIRKHYPDAVPKKNSAGAAPPPPPPPPPPLESDYAEAYPDYRELRRDSGSARSPGETRFGLDGQASSPTDGSMRKRKRETEDSITRREGRRQRETTARRRTAPEVADVYSRRW